MCLASARAVPLVLLALMRLAAAVCFAALLGANRPLLGPCVSSAADEGFPDNNAHTNTKKALRRGLHVQEALHPGGVPGVFREEGVEGELGRRGAGAAPGGQDHGRRDDLRDPAHPLQNEGRPCAWVALWTAPGARIMSTKHRRCLP